jgi:hypothetical protein
MIFLRVGCIRIQPSRALLKVPALVGGDLGVGDGYFHRKIVFRRLTYLAGS